tara:strand:+ start:1483 stop:1671 length:189 start_codon:yes stop_codon:yes gene_type:complete
MIEITNMYSLTKDGRIIFIPFVSKTKMEYYKEHFGLFETKEEAETAKKHREKVSKQIFGDLL